VSRVNNFILENYSGVTNTYIDLMSNYKAWSIYCGSIIRPLGFNI